MTDEQYDAMRVASWKRQGIKRATIKRYDALFKRQDGKCAICLKRSHKRRLALDHDHETGLIRGLLCRRCNYYMGWFEKDGRIERMLEYLKLI